MVLHYETVVSVYSVCPIPMLYGETETGSCFANNYCICFKQSMLSAHVRRQLKECDVVYMLKNLNFTTL